MLPSLQDLLGSILLFIQQGPLKHTIAQHLGKADDGVERGAQLMGHDSKKIRLGPIGLLECLVLVFDLPSLGLELRDIHQGNHKALLRPFR